DREVVDHRRSVVLAQDVDQPTRRQSDDRSRTRCAAVLVQARDAAELLAQRELDFALRRIEADVDAGAAAIALEIGEPLRVRFDADAAPAVALLEQERIADVHAVERADVQEEAIALLVERLRPDQEILAGLRHDQRVTQEQAPAGRENAGGAQDALEELPKPAGPDSPGRLSHCCHY